MPCGLLSNIGIYIFLNMMYNNKANVLADLYGLLSAAKNLPELNIKESTVCADNCNPITFNV